MKSISQPGLNDVKRIRYKQAHEAARKDVERAFAVLKKKWAIVRTHARSRSLKRITHLMYTCIILHNMIHKEKGKTISPDFYPEEQHREDDPYQSEGIMAAIYSLYIINKSGGLIFYKDYGLQGIMDTNDTLRLALWHSMHAIRIVLCYKT
ncbi:putative nuclease HARBI1 isoform X2 [Tanacetum coccineum]